MKKIKKTFNSDDTEYDFRGFFEDIKLSMFRLDNCLDSDDESEIEAACEEFFDTFTDGKPLLELMFRYCSNDFRKSDSVFNLKK